VPVRVQNGVQYVPVQMMPVQNGAQYAHYPQHVNIRVPLQNLGGGPHVTPETQMRQHEVFNAPQREQVMFPTQDEFQERQLQPVVVQRENREACANSVPFQQNWMEQYPSLHAQFCENNSPAPMAEFEYYEPPNSSVSAVELLQFNEYLQFYGDACDINIGVPDMETVLELCRSKGVVDEDCQNAIDIFLAVSPETDINQLNQKLQDLTSSQSILANVAQWKIDVARSTAEKVQRQLELLRENEEFWEAEEETDDYELDVSYDYDYDYVEYDCIEFDD